MSMNTITGVQISQKEKKEKENTNLNIEERVTKADCGVVCVYLHVGSISRCPFCTSPCGNPWCPYI